MRIGVFSDAHGNEAGFNTCYEYLVGEVDVIYYLGDAVGYFPLSNQIIDTLRLHNIECLKGNHDAMILGELQYDDEREEIYQVKKSAKAISEQNLNFLKKLPGEKKVNIDNRKLLFVHGSPLDTLNGYVYPDSDISTFEDMPYDVIFMGHTHRPFIKKTAKKKKRFKLLLEIVLTSLFEYSPMRASAITWRLRSVAKILIEIFLF